MRALLKYLTFCHEKKIAKPEKCAEKMVAFKSWLQNEWQEHSTNMRVRRDGLTGGTICTYLVGVFIAVRDQTPC